MTVRIDWNTSALQAAAENDDDGDDDTDKPVNSCELVWSGVSGKRAYSSFRFEECLTAPSARKLMHTHGLAHYWDMVVNGKSNGADAAAAAVFSDTAATIGIEKLLSAQDNDTAMT
jgi:hypothetical protein